MIITVDSGLKANWLYVFLHGPQLLQDVIDVNPTLYVGYLKDGLVELEIGDISAEEDAPATLVTLTTKGFRAILEHQKSIAHAHALQAEDTIKALQASLRSLQDHLKEVKTHYKLKRRPHGSSPSD